MMALGTYAAWTAIAILVAGDCWFLWELWNAPYGYQNEDGFHFGHEPEGPQSGITPAAATRDAS